MTIILFSLGILFGSLGAILMKIGADAVGGMSLDGSLADKAGYAIKLLTNVSVVGGMSLYFVSAVLWLYLLTKLEVSYVQPILALTYVITPILAILFLNETVSISRWIGIAVIIVGVFVVAQSS